MNEVNLYYTNILNWDIELLKNDLSQDELNALKSISHQLTLHQKIVNRVLLKRLLSKHYGIEWDDLIFTYNDRGKPALKYHLDLHFNSSHANELVLIGLSYSNIIGVDIEWRKKNLDEDGIAKYFFSAEEYNAYIHLRVKNNMAFYQFWTAKEAIIKALGRGLWETKDLPQIKLEQEQLIIEHKSRATSAWHLTFLDIHKEYTACLAINRQDIKINIQYLSEL